MSPRSRRRGRRSSDREWRSGARRRTVRNRWSSRSMRAQVCRSPFPSWSAPRSDPSSRSGCRIRRYGHDRCHSGPASPGDRRKTPCGIFRIRGSGRSPGSNPPTSSRRGIPDGATSSAGWCNSAPAGTQPSPFAVSCCSPSVGQMRCHARSSSVANLYSPASARNFSHVASSTSIPETLRCCSRMYSTSPG